VRLSTALQLVSEDLREQEPDRYDHLDDIDVYREWVDDGPTVAEIDEAERGRQLDAQLADAYRLVLTAGYGPVVTVLLGTQEHADELDPSLEPTGAGQVARLVVAS
jgi:hypothetical protein